MNTNGKGFTNLYNCITCYPYCTLALSGSVLYGTTESGGTGTGSVFALNTDGTGFTNLHSFSVADGKTPLAGLALSGTTLYGTTYYGGDSGLGTVFAVSTDGTGFTNLHSFSAASSVYPHTNWDGYNPFARLVLSGKTLYGTAESGGSVGYGTVFAVNTDGTGFRTLHSFTLLDGAFPQGGLTLSGNILYGTTYSGGNGGNGVVFSIFLQPQLAIIPTGESVVLTWPTNYSDFVLQSTTNLLSPAVWTTNSVSPVLANGQNTVTNPISVTQQFFRLSQ